MSPKKCFFALFPFGTKGPNHYNTTAIALLWVCVGNIGSVVVVWALGAKSNFGLINFSSRVLNVSTDLRVFTWNTNSWQNTLKGCYWIQTRAHFPWVDCRSRARTSQKRVRVTKAKCDKSVTKLVTEWPLGPSHARARLHEMTKRSKTTNRTPQ